MDVDRITVDQVQNQRDKGKEIVFMDVRNARDWEGAESKIPGALRASTDLEVEGVLRKVSKDRTVIAYCT